jgi:hypothetical protein
MPTAALWNVRVVQAQRGVHHSLLDGHDETPTDGAVFMCMVVIVASRQGLTVRRDHLPTATLTPVDASAR